MSSLVIKWIIWVLGLLAYWEFFQPNSYASSVGDYVGAAIFLTVWVPIGSSFERFVRRREQARRNRRAQETAERILGRVGLSPPTEEELNLRARGLLDDLIKAKAARGDTATPEP